MAQYEIVELKFPLPQDPNDRAELNVDIDNPQGMELFGSPEQGSVPEDVEIVQPNESPTQDLWVYANHHHLTITLATGSGDDPLQVSDTGFYNDGEDLKYVDIVVAEKDGDDKKAKKIRRRSVIVSG